MQKPVFMSVPVPVVSTVPPMVSWEFRIIFIPQANFASGERLLRLVYELELQ